MNKEQDKFNLREYLIRKAVEDGRINITRDSSTGQETLVPFKASTCFMEAAQNADLAWKTLKKMSREEADRRAGEDYDRMIAYCNRAIKEEQQVKIRNENIRKGLEAYCPPPCCEEFKERLLSRLSPGSAYDERIEVWEKRKSEVKRCTGEEAMAENKSILEGAARDHRRIHEEEVRKAEEKNEWARKFMESLESLPE